MSTYTDLPAAPTAPATKGRPSRWGVVWWLLGVLAVVAAVAALARVEGADPLPARDITTAQRINTACQTWVDAQGNESAASSGWCGYMTNWMTNQMRAGHMSGSMMWGNPQAMRATCTQTAASYHSISDPTAWCQKMVTWMSAHVGNWNTWKMNPSMVGG